MVDWLDDQGRGHLTRITRTRSSAALRTMPSKTAQHGPPPGSVGSTTCFEFKIAPYFFFMCPKGVASRPATLLITNSPRLVPLLCVSSLPSSTEFAVIRGTTLQHGCRARSESIVTQVFMVASFLPGPKPNSTPSTRVTVPVLHPHGQPVEVGKMQAR